MILKLKKTKKIDIKTKKIMQSDWSRVFSTTTQD